jgi:hypothetical protein
LTKHGDAKSIRSEYNGVRRRELKKFELIRRNYSPSSQVNYDEILEIYSDALMIDSTEHSLETLAALNKFVEASNNGLISFKCLYGLDKKLDGLICTVDINKTRNLVMSLVSPRARNAGMMTYLIDYAIQSSLNDGLLLFDFNGANSPLRAQNKHTYGSEPVLYFRIIVSWRNASARELR